MDKLKNSVRDNCMEIKADLTETLHRSMHLAVCIEKLTTDIFPGLARNKIARKIRMIDKSLRNLQKDFNNDSESKSPAKLRDKTPSPKQPVSVQLSRPRSSTLSAKRQLNKSLVEVNQRLRLTKAGKLTSSHYMGDKNRTPPIIQQVKSFRETSSQINSNEEFSFATFNSNDTSKTKPLIHFSFTNGKTEDPVTLPSFDEYCESANIDVTAGQVKKTIFKRLTAAEKKLQDFEDEINGLSIFCSENTGAKWNGDKNLLMKLSKSPNHKHQIIRSYIEKRARQSRLSQQVFSSIEADSRLREMIEHKFNHSAYMNSPGIEQTNIYHRDSHKGSINYGNILSLKNSVTIPERSAKPKRRARKSVTKRDSKFKEIRLKPEQILQTCADSFSIVRENQDAKISGMLKRLDYERFYTFKEKISLIQSDNQKFKDLSHSIERLRAFREIIEGNRQKRRAENFKQIEIYSEMLEYLKNRRKEPTPNQMLFLEIIKNVIEEGWVIDFNIFSEIIQLYTEDELKEPELRGLVNTVRRCLNIEAGS
jgi:hypothetical protein